jgi:hypothetical protein
MLYLIVTCRFCRAGSPGPPPGLATPVGDTKTWPRVLFWLNSIQVDCVAPLGFASFRDDVPARSVRPLLPLFPPPSIHTHPALVLSRCAYPSLKTGLEGGSERESEERRVPARVQPGRIQPRPLVAARWAYTLCKPWPTGAECCPAGRKYMCSVAGRVLGAETATNHGMNRFGSPSQWSWPLVHAACVSSKASCSAHYLPVRCYSPAQARPFFSWVWVLPFLLPR